MKLSRKEIEGIYFACINYRNCGANADSKKIVDEIQCEIENKIAGIND